MINPNAMWCLFVPAILGIVWLVMEFQGRRWIRVVSGLAAILASYLIAAGVGSMEHFNANAWYGQASRVLIETTLEELEQGRIEPLIVELQTLRNQFQPTYENRARYDRLIEEFTLRVAHGR